MAVVGKPGTGKSQLLRQLIALVPKGAIPVVICFKGNDASRFCGDKVLASTIHSFLAETPASKIDSRSEPSKKFCKKWKDTRWLTEKMGEPSDGSRVHKLVLFIDEFALIPKALMSLLERSIQKIHEKPIVGHRVQVSRTIMFGDLLQGKPIGKTPVTCNLFKHATRFVLNRCMRFDCPELHTVVEWARRIRLRPATPLGTQFAKTDQVIENKFYDILQWHMARPSPARGLARMTLTGTNKMVALAVKVRMSVEQNKLLIVVPKKTKRKKKSSFEDDDEEDDIELPCELTLMHKPVVKDFDYYCTSTFRGIDKETGEDAVIYNGMLATVKSVIFSDPSATAASDDESSGKLTTCASEIRGKGNSKTGEVEYVEVEVGGRLVLTTAIRQATKTYVVWFWPFVPDCAMTIARSQGREFSTGDVVLDMSGVPLKSYFLMFVVAATRVRKMEQLRLVNVDPETLRRSKTVLQITDRSSKYFDQQNFEWFRAAQNQRKKEEKIEFRDIITPKPPPLPNDHGRDGPPAKRHKRD